MQKLILALFLSLFSSLVLGQDIESRIPTAFFSLHGGLSVYKSEMERSSTTGVTSGYSLGVYAGKFKAVGIILNTEASTFAFLTDNEDSGNIAMSWNDTIIRYRYGAFYAGGVITNTSWVVSRFSDDEDVTSESGEYLNLSANGFGGNIGALIPTGKTSFMYIDVVSSTPSTVQASPVTDLAGETVEREATLGARTEIDIGASVNLTKKLFRGIFGYKYRTYSITVDSEAFAESHNTTYVGIKMSGNF